MPDPRRAQADPAPPAGGRGVAVHGGGLRSSSRRCSTSCGRTTDPSPLTIESTRFGTLEIHTEAVVEFPEGLIGLGGRRFALLAAGADTPFAWLHSLDDPDLALPVTDPFPFFPDYQVELSDEAAEHIGVRLEDKPEVLVTVRAGDQAKSVCANLRAPIIVAGGLAHQAINEASGAPLRAPLAA